MYIIGKEFLRLNLPLVREGGREKRKIQWHSF